MIADLCNIPIGNVKKPVPSFLIKKSVLHYQDFQLYLMLS